MRWRGPSRRRRALLIGLAVVGVLGLFALWVGRSRMAWDQACAIARRQLPALLGAEVGLGRCEVDPAQRTVRIYGLSAGAPGSERPLFSADALEVTVAGVQPVTGRLELEHVRLVRPRLWLDLSRPAPATRPGDCPLRALERLEVETLEVRGAEIRVLLPGGRRAEVDGLELSWKTRRRDAEFQLRTNQGQLELGNGRPPLALAGLAVEGALSPGGRELEISRGELSVEDAQLTFGGKVEDLCQPSFAVDTQLFLPLKTLSKAMPLGEVQGHLWAQATLSGRVPDLRVTGELLGKGVTLGALRPGDFTVRAALAGQSVTVSELTVPVGPGQVRATGELKLTPGLPLKAKVDLEQVSLFQVFERVGLTGTWVDLLATGPVNLAGKLSPLPELNGSADLKVARFVTWSHPVDRPGKQPPILSIPAAEVTLGVGIHHDRVELTGAKVKVGRGRADASVVIPYGGVRPITIDALAEPLALEDVGPLAAIPLGGVGAARVAIRIPPNELELDGELALQDAAFSGFALGNLHPGDLPGRGADPGRRHRAQGAHRLHRPGVARLPRRPARRASRRPDSGRAGGRPGGGPGSGLSGDAAAPSGAVRDGEGIGAPRWAGGGAGRPLRPRPRPGQPRRPPAGGGRPPRAAGGWHGDRSGEPRAPRTDGGLSRGGRVDVRRPAPRPLPHRWPSAGGAHRSGAGPTAQGPGDADPGRHRGRNRRQPRRDPVPGRSADLPLRPGAGSDGAGGAGRAATSWRSRAGRWPTPTSTSAPA